MGQIDLFRALQQDERVLDLAAAAMYKIREPRGSTRIAFERVSPAKKARNRELAVQILTAVLARYPDPLRVSSPDEIKTFMAEQMYKMLAPNKSESFPFDQRTPFARTYYQERAETFMRNFLMPLAEQQSHEPPRSVASSPSAPLDSNRETPRAPGMEPSRPVRSMSSGSSNRSPSLDPGVQLTSQATSSPANSASADARETIHAITSKAREESGAQQAPASPTSQSTALSMIGCLLLVIVILLVVLVIRTF